MSVVDADLNFWFDRCCAPAFWSQCELAPHQERLAHSTEWLGPAAGRRWRDGVRGFPGGSFDGAVSGRTIHYAQPFCPEAGFGRVEYRLPFAHQVYLFRGFW